MEGIPNTFEYSDFVKEYKNRYERVYVGGSIEQSIEVQEEWALFANKLAEKYGRDQLEKYALYHAISGSTPNGPTIADDLEGEDSIAGFVESLEKKYGTG